MQAPDNGSALKRVLLSKSVADRRYITNDQYSIAINHFDLANASWNWFLLSENQENEYLPWYDDYIGHEDPQEDSYLKTDANSKILIDGPNIEGSTDGSGILLEGHSFAANDSISTDFYLYGLDKTQGFKEHADVNPFFKSDKFEGEELDCCAIARRKYFALATHSKKTNQHVLNIFAYDVEDITKNGVIVTRVAWWENTPHFKKLCWIHGRNLLGLTHDKKLFVIPNTDKDNANQQAGHKRRMYEQKMPMGIDDIAVHVPKKFHEVLFLANNKIYAAHLARRTAQGKIPYRCIYPDSDTDDDDHIEGNMDRIWFNQNEVTVAQLRDQKIIDDPSRHCNFMSFFMKYPILEKVLEYIKPGSIRKNRFLRH